VTVYRKIIVSASVKESKKLILHPDPHQKLITSRGSPLPLTPAYRVWSTSINVFVSYLAHRQNEWQTE